MPRVALRDAVLMTVLPGAPPPPPAFWARLSAAAPPSLWLSLRLIIALLGLLGPPLAGAWRPFPALDPAARARALQRFAALPGLGASVDLLKLIACFAHFDDPAVQAAHRRGGP
jgi:hypothetical protein